MTDLMVELARAAAKISDGHFTVMKFSTKWRVGFFTLLGRVNTLGMAEGKTLAEAAEKALASPETYAGGQRGRTKHESHLRESLRMDLEGTAEWRRQKATEYPSDARNLAAAEL